MQKIRESIPFSAFLAAKLACERVNVRAAPLFGECELMIEDLEPRRKHPLADTDDDVVVMTIN